jgi:hypothetical protein
MFYQEFKLEEKLCCCKCKIKFDVPKCIPCGHFICFKCENEYSTKNSTVHVCSICLCEHQIPKDGFPIAELLVELMELVPVKVYRGELHAKTSELIIDLDKTIENFGDKMKNSEEIIRNYIDSLRNSVDLATESKIDQLNKHRDDLISRINSYEQKCLNNIQTEKYFELEKKLQESKKSLKKWRNELNEADLNKKIIQETMDSAGLLKTNVTDSLIRLESLMFEFAKLTFTETKNKIEQKDIGVLVPHINGIDVSPFLNNVPKKIELVNIGTSKCFLINLKDTVCLVTSECPISFNIHIEAYKSDGIDYKLCRESSNTLNGFFATKFADLILVSFSDVHNSGCYKIAIYDKDVTRQQYINFDYSIEGLYANETEAFVLCQSNLHVLDLNLQLLRTIELVNISNNPFKNADINNIIMKDDKIFVYDMKDIFIYTQDTLELLQTVNINQTRCLFQPISSKLFLFIEPSSKCLKLFDSNSKCLLDGIFLKHIDDISCIDYDDTEGNLNILDKKNKCVYILPKIGYSFLN